MKISFLAPVAPGAILTCTAEVVSGGRTVAFVEAGIVDSDDRLVARATSTYIIRERTPA
jgi:acyl-coenzyme A thioesterase PaaI-like protein